jgi:uncharacterized protein YfiM (DUF2279 family)
VKKWLLYLFILCSASASSQDTAAGVDGEPGKNIDYKKRRWVIGGLTTAGYGGSFTFLSQAWYKEHPRTSFHTFNDAGEWNQIDKAGHAWTTYHTSRLTTNMWRWAGIKDDKAILYGTGSSLLFMLSIEYLDGHSADWGWSWADVGANFFGAALYAAQELGWKAQKLSIKFSSHYKNYKELDLKRRADDLYGASFQGRLLKDYNAQTYWLSANIKSFFPETILPAWLNMSVGYGADGMFGGYENIAKSKTDGAVTFDRRDIKRYRQYYFAPDVDFTKIKTRSKLLQSVFSALNVLKFPAPAVEFSNGRFKVKALAY